MRLWDKTLGEGTSVVESNSSKFDKQIIERIMKLGYERQLIEKDIIDNPLGTFAQLYKKLEVELPKMIEVKTKVWPHSSYTWGAWDMNKR